MSLNSNDLFNGVQEEKKSYSGRLATVVETVTEDGICKAKVQFYGEDEPSNIYYPVLYASEPSAQDIVVLQEAGDSMVVAGKLKMNGSPAGPTLTTASAVNAVSTGSLNAGAGKVVSVTINIPAEYSIMGISEVAVRTSTATNSSFSGTINVVGFYQSSNTVQVAVKNNGSSAASAYVHAALRLAKIS